MLKHSSSVLKNEENICFGWLRITRGKKCFPSGNEREALLKGHVLFSLAKDKSVHSDKEQFKYILSISICTRSELQFTYYVFIIY